ncbi:uncharacterized protein PAC_00339 [Phialocephala subalpina]|uniref:Uncharacterized protein n=1 Tax=Phialocephala subalpina TaxID=576137 RepID=A0A1L7WCG2_9HELO|nr:uncharacterized protein PAC_00339 [Phialocephala subalpina]
MSVPGRQLIVIACEFVYNKYGIEERVVRACAVFYKVPTLLHTNMESRTFAQRIYRHEFADRLGGNDIWMDTSKDVLCFKHQAPCDVFFSCKAKRFYTDPSFASNKPLVERLPYLAFSYREARFMRTPQFLTQMGQPQRIYYLVKFWENTDIQTDRLEDGIDKGWHVERADENLAGKSNRTSFEDIGLTV